MASLARSASERERRGVFLNQSKAPQTGHQGGGSGGSRSRDQLIGQLGGKAPNTRDRLEESFGATGGGKSRKGGGQALPEATKGYFQSFFGRDFDDVRIHTDAAAGNAAKGADATAFAQGKDIFLGSSALAAGSKEQMQILAHELTHVVQEEGATGMKPGMGEVGDAFEREADEAAGLVGKGDGLGMPDYMKALSGGIGGLTGMKSDLQGLKKKKKSGGMFGEKGKMKVKQKSALKQARAMGRKDKDKDKVKIVDAKEFAVKVLNYFFNSGAGHPTPIKEKHISSHMMWLAAQLLAQWMGPTSTDGGAAAGKFGGANESWLGNPEVQTLFAHNQKNSYADYYRNQAANFFRPSFGDFGKEVGLGG